MTGGGDNQHTGLPVAGYSPQSGGRVELVNENKRIEERILRRIDMLARDPNVDQRWLHIARTGVEQAFMAMNRAIFRPDRISLPEDEGAPE